MLPPACLSDALPHSVRLRGQGLTLDEEVVTGLLLVPATPPALVIGDFVHYISQTAPVAAWPDSS